MGCCPVEASGFARGRLRGEAGFFSLGFRAPLVFPTGKVELREIEREIRIGELGAWVASAIGWERELRAALGLLGAC